MNVHKDNKRVTKLTEYLFIHSSEILSSKHTHCFQRQTLLSERSTSNPCNSVWTSTHSLTYMYLYIVFLNIWKNVCFCESICRLQMFSSVR